MKESVQSVGDMKSVGKTTKYEEEKEPTFIREH